MRFDSLRFEHSDAEQTLLVQLVSTPPEEIRRTLKALTDDELYAVHVMVGTAYDRKREFDVELRRQVDEVVRWRFPRGWPSPGSSIPVESET